ncbi:MAG: thermonuclease family protein [Paracoccaceae bacterium]
MRGRYRRAGRWRWRLTGLVAAVMLLPAMADAVSAVMHRVRAPDGSCRILSVVDGDTVVLSCASGTGRARLTGFDAPELFSPQCPAEYLAAQKAKWGLRHMLFTARDIAIRPQGRDRYDRLLVEVWLDGTPLAQRMEQAGLARAYSGGRRGGWCA